MQNKVSIIGAGAVGATLAQRVLESGLADVVLVDIAKNMACGKSLDMMDAAPIIGHEKMITGTDDYGEIRASDIVVITAGFPRKPGMTRDELIAKNSAIIKGVSGKIKMHAPDAVVIVVTNPLDAMAYLAYKTTGFSREKVFGMAGLLDGGRFINLLANELKVARSSIKTFVLGSHGDTMVPVWSHTSVSGKRLASLIHKDKLDVIIRKTADRGAEIVNLLGIGSAYYSPSAAAFRMMAAVLNDTKETIAVSAYLNGEYGLSDLFIGVPCVLGKAGIEKVVEIDLEKSEKEAFVKSAQALKKVIETL